MFPSGSRLLLTFPGLQGNVWVRSVKREGFDSKATPEVEGGFKTSRAKEDKTCRVEILEIPLWDLIGLMGMESQPLP